MPVGSTARTGGGSVAVAKDLDMLRASSRPAGVITLVFPGSGNGRALSAKGAAAACAELLAAKGGRP